MDRVRKLVLTILKYPLPAAIPKSLTKKKKNQKQFHREVLPSQLILSDKSIQGYILPIIEIYDFAKQNVPIEILKFWVIFCFQNSKGDGSLSEAGDFARMHKSLNFLKRGALHTFFYVFMLQFAYSTKLELTTENSRRG